MMTIFIEWKQLKEFQQIVKENNICHGPFRKGDNGHNIGYHIDIFDPGPIGTYLNLKYRG